MEKAARDPIRSLTVTWGLAVKMPGPPRSNARDRSVKPAWLPSIGALGQCGGSAACDILSSHRLWRLRRLPLHRAVSQAAPAAPGGDRSDVRFATMARTRLQGTCRCGRINANVGPRADWAATCPRKWALQGGRSAAVSGRRQGGGSRRRIVIGSGLSWVKVLRAAEEGIPARARRWRGAGLLGRRPQRDQPSAPGDGANHAAVDGGGGRRGRACRVGAKR